jgi:hypothetical protein
MKPRLPPEIEAVIPDDVLRHLYRFVAHNKKEKPVEHPLSRSPNAMRDLRLIQYKMLSGKNERYLWDLDDFILDKAL